MLLFRMLFTQLHHAWVILFVLRIMLYIHLVVIHKPRSTYIGGYTWQYLLWFVLYTSTLYC